ncbi:periplasmic sensor signal transduction histidine kinase [Beggiatoa sp. PS]|nr:periplasmic sensor signal transduction histidine kinase [Beggiatoa sp. PS]
MQPLHSLQLKGSLTRTTLIKMGLRIAVVIIAVTLVSYWHVMSNLELQVIEQLDKYITERGQRESNLFKLAEDNHTVFKDEFLARLKAMGNNDPVERFNALFEKLDDGTVRLLASEFYNKPETGGTTNKGLTAFIGQNVDITADVRRRIMISYDMVKTYGPPWRSLFSNVYTTLPENIAICYWPEVSWNLDAQADLNMVQDEWFYMSDLKHNPQRKTVWVGPYYDAVAKNSNISAETPVYFNGQHIMTIGYDIVLNDLVERTFKDHLEGAYNVILREDGHLISHPEHTTHIQEQGGSFDIDQLGDQHLMSVLQMIKNRQPDAVVLNHVQYDEYLAVTQIDGPDWYFVTVYPQSLLSHMAFDTAIFILMLGILSLFIEITLLFIVLRTQMAKPLREFIESTQKVASGDFSLDNTHLPVHRSDEIGQLAQSFQQMAGQLKTSFDTLETKNIELERLNTDLQQAIQVAEVANQALNQTLATLDAKVIERTAQLNAKVEELTKTRHELVQSEKMASLGRLVAGFAHELNTPIGVAVSGASLLQEKAHLVNQLIEQEEVDEDDLISALDSINQMAELTLSNLRRASSLVGSFKRTAIDQSSDDIRQFQVKRALEDVINTLHNQFKKTAIDIQVDCSNDLVISSFPGALDQILTNLMMNSLIHGFEEGKNTGHIRIVVQRVENQLHLTYSDTGKGIPAENLLNIFEPFFTTHRAHGGSGLGLYICYNIVSNQFKGQMTCESTIDQGTTFYIDFPIDTEGKI